MPLVNEVTAKMKCDGPDCIVHVEIDMQALQENPASLPDAAYRMVIITLFDQKQYSFCSDYCAAMWLRKHVPLKSPSELAKEMTGTIKKLEEVHTDAVIEHVPGPSSTAQAELGEEA